MVFAKPQVHPRASIKKYFNTGNKKKKKEKTFSIRNSRPVVPKYAS